MTFLLKNITELTSKDFDKVDVVCLGHFNVLHPGHFRFINFAASQGNGLLVLLKGDKDFNANERHYFFPESDRAEALSHISKIDYIATRGDKTLVECIKLTKPKFLVLGNEFERDRPKEIDVLINHAKQLDIRVLFHSGDRNLNLGNKFQSGEATFSKQDATNENFVRTCRRRGIDLTSAARAMDRLSSINTLVIGDLIVDEFISCEPLGLSSEAPVVVVKEIEKTKFIGGAGIVATHVSNIGANCHFLSVAGNDEQREFALEKLSDYQVNAEVLIDRNRPTTFKSRYMVGNQKIFRVSRLMDTDINAELEDQLIDKVKVLAPTLDNIIVSDFVYGVITSRVLRSIMILAKRHNIKIFGDLQCSSQVGNVLKFRGFDMMFPTEKEARIAINNKDDGLEFVAQTVFEKSECDNLMIKLGADGLIAYSRRDSGFIESEHFPALSVNPVDVSGAGDSVLASVATAMTAGLDVLEAAAWGCVIASCAVETLGNLPVDKNVASAKVESLTHLF